MYGVSRFWFPFSMYNIAYVRLTCKFLRMMGSSDEQNIFCLYKERFFWLFTHCICLIVLKKPHFPSFPFYAPFFFPLSPLITSFLQLYTNLTCIFSSNSVPFSFIRLFFHALSRSRCFCFLLCFTFFHNLSHASMICAIMCPICMR